MGEADSFQKTIGNYFGRIFKHIITRRSLSITDEAAKRVFKTAAWARPSRGSSRTLLAASSMLQSLGAAMRSSRISSRTPSLTMKLLSKWSSPFRRKGTSWGRSLAMSTGDLVRQYSAQDLFRQHSAQGLLQKYLQTHQEEDRFHHHQCLQKIFQNKLDLMPQLPSTKSPKPPVQGLFGSIWWT